MLAGKLGRRRRTFDSHFMRIKKLIKNPERLKKKKKKNPASPHFSSSKAFSQTQLPANKNKIKNKDIKKN